ncbi:MAG: hypothetical protein QM780_18015 [Hyphomicrobium sp.]|uniref:hypothetical protein n=1 Tax=Hyphomicrobium sp. TaxID=82 RepID=UPI0039E25A28
MPRILLGNRGDWREVLGRPPPPPCAEEPPPQKPKHFWKRRRPPPPVAMAPRQTAAVQEFEYSEFPLCPDSIKHPDIDFILPFLVCEYDLLSQCPEARRKCIYPDSKTANNLDDKGRFNALMIELGYEDCIPRVGAPRDLEFPIVCKKRIDECGLHTRVISHPSELDHLDDPDFYFQEYVPGVEEYVTHVICLHGVITYLVSYKYYFGMDVYSKSPELNPRSVEDLGGFIPSELTKIILDLSYTGCACFNYKLRDGRPAIFELNPRVGASFMRESAKYLGAYMKAVEDHNGRKSMSSSAKNAFAPRVANEMSVRAGVRGR